MNFALPSSLRQTTRQLWAVDSFPYSLRILISLSATMAFGWLTDQMALVMPVYLGTIACALAETDDNWRGRLRALLVTLLCFALTAFAVQAMFDRPWLFVCGLVVATFCLTMLGAISPRYKAIAYGSLILSIYTTIGMDHQRTAGTQHAFWLEPVLLLSGAAWYGLLSVLWCALFPHQPVQQHLASLYQTLGQYLRLKASLFEPVRGIDQEVKRLGLAQRNGEVVGALNTAKETILSRLGTAPSQRMQHYLRLYFIAQDVHERASSSHSPYSELTEAFFHSDVLFRCQRLLSLQGAACARIGQDILLSRPIDKGPASAQALRDLQDALVHLEDNVTHPSQRWLSLLGTLTALAKNLGKLEARLARASLNEQEVGADDESLLDRSPQSLRDAWDRVRLQLTPNTPLFRHAVRLSLALAAGYGLLHWIHASQGYWIMLTTLFVCQQTYGATRRRMVQRIIGTLLGLVAGWALFTLFPSLLVQSIFAVVAGVVFFASRTRRYTLGTAAITLLVLLCFNQIGDGHVLIVPRLVDTVLGSLIAGVAMFLVLPDWQGRRMHEVGARAMACCAIYLRAIMAQYHSGKRDDLAYRLARRNAHNADAAFSTALFNLYQEPGFVQGSGDGALRFLLLSHTLLNYLSALGAHREQMQEAAGPAALQQATTHISAVLEQLSESLAKRQPVPPARPEEAALLAQLQQGLEGAEPVHQVVQTQLLHIGQLLAPLRLQAARLLQLQPPEALPNAGTAAVVSPPQAT
jgi:YccS/YhfK family integral membrane protein